MDRYKILKQNPQKSTRLIGVDMEIFDFILGKVQEYLSQKKSDNPISNRGLKARLSIENQLLLTFIYLKSYPTFFDLGFQFGISESYASRIFHKYREILHQIIGLKSKKKITINDCKKIIVDVTVQPVERPIEKQEEYYWAALRNGAKKHCIKAELQINADNEEIISGRQSACFVEKGKPHDITLFKKHEIDMDKKIEILADSGY
jgi:hypothetical protein